MSESYPRIGIISDERFPSHHTDTQQIVKNASALARTGLSVELIVPRRTGRLTWSRQRRLDELTDYYNLEDADFVREIMTLPAGDIRPPVKLSHGLAAPVYAAAQRFDVAHTRNLLPALACFSLGLKLVVETYRTWGDSHPGLVAILARAHDGSG